MVQRSLRTTCLLGALSVLELCSGLWAFQSSSSDVNITPRQTQTDHLKESVRDHLRIDTSMVLIPAHVTTMTGTPLVDLSKDRFHVYDDDHEQEITYFAKDDAPLSIGLVFDSSASMHDKIHKSAEAASALLKTASAQDEFFLVEFDERPRLSIPFTPDSDEVYKQILHTRAFGRTSLLDAIQLSLDQMKKARNSRKAIVILSDGGDNRSRLTFKQIKNNMIESDVQLYAMGIFDPENSRKHTSEEANGPRLLNELAEVTGGKHFPVGTLDELPAISTRIGNELRSEYLLGYSPTNSARDGKYHQVKLDLAADEPLRIRYRQGYYAPAQ